MVGIVGGIPASLVAAWLWEKLNERNAVPSLSNEHRQIQDGETIEKILRTLIERKPE